jgi:MFS family permease
MLRSSLRFARGNILIFALSDMLGNFARSMVFPYVSLYILALGGNAAEIGLVASLGQLAGLALLPVAGYIADRSDRIRIIALAGFLSVIFQLLNVIAPDWRVVALAAFLSGTVVFVFPAYSSLIADSLSTEGRGRGIAIMNTISSSLFIFGPYIAGLVIERAGANLGMRILFAVLIVFYLSSTLLQVRFLKESAGPPRERVSFQALLDALGRVYRDIPRLVRDMSRSLKALTLVITLTFMAHAMTGSFWVVYAIGPQGLSTAQWGLILLVESVLKWVLLIPAGVLVDRWGRTASLIAALALFTLGTPLYILARGLYPVLAVRLLLAFPYVLAIPACTALLADLVPRAVRGQMMAAIGQGGIMLGAVGAPGGPAIGYLIIPALMLASLAGGYLYTLHPTIPWILATVIGIFSIALTALYVRDPGQVEV